MHTKPLFNWLNHRSAGIQLNPTSLPGDSAIGNLGYHAYKFIDFLADSAMTYWQLCPLGPTGFGDSPYQCFSSFAGNPYLIDLNSLLELGLLTQEELSSFQPKNQLKIDYGHVYETFWPLLKKAHAKYRKSGGSVQFPGYISFEQFEELHASWLKPYAYFMTLKEYFGGQPWHEWPEEVKSYKNISASPILQEKTETIEIHIFAQYLFFNQWELLKYYANKKGIKIIGDIPIFVAHDSSDVWSNQDLFKLDKKGNARVQAGVPPDYFSATGQLWGNPVYNWSQHKRTKYQWWISRLQANLNLYDALRIDHFLGFDRYWEVPLSSPDATQGQWAKGPGLDFFKALKSHFSKDLPLIAEDLGVITQSSSDLLQAIGLPGMAVLQFAFGGESLNTYLPHNLKRNQVLYPGTHDSDTCWGWYQSLDEQTKTHLHEYLRIDNKHIAWDFIRTSYASVSNLIIIQLQDLMNLGPEARLNTPGQASGNWAWRYTEDQLHNLKKDSTTYLKSLAHLYNR